MPKIIFILNLASTFYMVGLIWFVQIVHYPLFKSVGKDNFVNYEASHSFLTTMVVLPPMLIEMFTAFALIFYPTPSLKGNLVYLLFFMVVLIWTSTGLLQVPQHSILGAGFNETAHNKLVYTNWIRTILWTLRGIILCFLI